MKIPEVQKNEILPDKIYLWQMVDGPIVPVWLWKDNHDYLCEWGDEGGWELEILVGKFYGPVELI